MTNIDYPYSYENEELDRLSQQHRVWFPETQSLLQIETIIQVVKELVDLMRPDDPRSVFSAWPTRQLVAKKATSSANAPD